MNRKKPTGQTWIDFVELWRVSDHAGKLRMAKFHGVSYDVAKHWVSDGDTTPIEGKPNVTYRPKDEEPFDCAQEILSIPVKTKLDFVSFDIETNNLKADFGVLMTAVIKPFGQEPIVFRGDSYPTWREHRDDDSQIACDVIRELSSHAVVITHYGRKFDIPWIRAKATRYGLPNLPPMFGIDTWRIAKDNYCVGSRRLAALASYFQLGAKSGVEGNLWNKAILTGDKEAMDEIVLHNVQDCALLERLAAMSFSYLRFMPKL